MNVTFHAVMKYVSEIWREMPKREYTFESAKKKIEELYEKSIPEPMSAGLIKRIIDNQFEDCSYFKYRNWRLVVSNDTIVTVEKDSFKDTTLGYMKKKNLGKRR